jgi:hypothetical protein
MSEIEDIILSRDRRSMSELRPFLANDFCTQAAKLILNAPGRALIATGFYITRAGASETDGPPGAYFIGRALKAMGFQVTYVSDHYSTPLFEGLVDRTDIVEFPMADAETSEAFAVDLLEQLQPSVVIAIERCSFTTPGRYLNARGEDTSEYHAKLDYLFMHHDKSIGIGDGGNEIGMGNLNRQISTVKALPNEPATTTVSELVIASVSNWGGYGLIAALSLLAGWNLLPSVAEEEHVIRAIVGNGAIDAKAGKPVPAVDGFSLEENGQTMEALHSLLDRHGIISA